MARIYFNAHWISHNSYCLQAVSIMVTNKYFTCSSRCYLNYVLSSLFFLLILFRSVKSQEQLWEISISIVKDWLSVLVLDQYGPTMGFEEEEEHKEGGENPTLSFNDDQQVLISEEGGSTRISFRKNTIQEEEELNEDSETTERTSFLHNGGRNSTVGGVSSSDRVPEAEL